MRKITKKDLTNNYFNLQLNCSSVKITSALSISAILAGFSLGSVVALLFINTSMLVRSMFILSIISSCIFILSVLSIQGSLEKIQTMIANLEFFETKEEKFRTFIKIEKDASLGAVMLILGIICFWSVLICSCFLYSVAFGIIMLFVFVPLLFLVFGKMSTASMITEFSVMEGKETNWLGHPLKYDDIVE